MNLCINFFGYSVSVSSQICYDADFGIVQPGEVQLKESIFFHKRDLNKP